MIPTVFNLCAGDSMMVLESKVKCSHLLCRNMSRSFIFNSILSLAFSSGPIILAIGTQRAKFRKELETFFTYVGRDEVDERGLSLGIHEKVEEVNRDAEVTEIMTLEEN